MLRIPISPLRTGLQALSFNPSAASLELDPEGFSGLDVQVRIDKEEYRYFVSLEVQATAHLVCDRTLVLFDHPVSASYAMLFTTDDLAEGTADGYDDIRVLAPSDQYLDLTEVVRDTVLLAVPLKRVAPEAEAEALPTQFGVPAEDTIDPRWSALQKLSTEETDL